MNRTLDVVRLHLVDRRIVTVAAVAVLVAVAACVVLTAWAGPTVPMASGLTTIAGFQTVALAGALPFLLSMGVTRRAFYTGTVLFVLAEAAVVGALLVVLDLVEQLSGGWGGIGYPIDTSWFQTGDPLTQWLAFAAPFFVTFPAVLLGYLLLVRWGWPGVAGGVAVGGAVALGVLFGLPLLLGGLLDPVAARAVVVPVVIGVVFVGAGWGVVRRMAT